MKTILGIIASLNLISFTAYASCESLIAEQMSSDLEISISSYFVKCHPGTYEVQCYARGKMPNTENVFYACKGILTTKCDQVTYVSCGTYFDNSNDDY